MKKNHSKTNINLFMSSLFDTIKVRIQLVHEPLYELCAKENKLCYIDKSYKVRGKFGTYATIASEANRTSLTIEASIPNFLSGQNLVGIENLKKGAIELIDAVLKRAGITPTEAEKKRYREGTFLLLRVDYAAHVNCGTPEIAEIFMTALRAKLAGKPRDFSAYHNETVYWGMYSNRRTLRAYNKGRKMNKKALGKHVYAATLLTREGQSMVRLELTLRADELKRLDLRQPGDWTVEVARDLLKEFIQRLLPLDGKVPDVANMNLLSPTLRDRLELWLRGSLDAFTRYPGSLSQSRREILRQTGIDIRSTLKPEEQQAYFRLLKDVMLEGWGYKCWESKWEKLKAGRPNKKT